MRLVHLSVTSIIGCLLGLVLLAALTLDSVSEVRTKQAQVAGLLALQARMDDFSVASDSLLLFGADAALLAAYRAEGELLQQRLRRMGDDSADARKAVHRVDELVDRVTREIEQNGDADGRMPSLGRGALGLPARSRIVLNQVAGLGGALDSSLDALLRERQRVIAREADWIGATLAGAALLFGILSVVAFLLIHRRVAAPAQTLSSTIEAIRAGDPDARAPVHGDDEMADVAMTLNQMLDERQTLDAELRARNERLRQFQQLIEGTDDLCAILDGEYRYILVNQAYLKSSARKVDELYGRPLAEFVGEPVFSEEIQPRLDRCLAGEPQRYELEGTHWKDGCRHLLVRYYPIDLSGSNSECRLGVVMTDVTDMRAAQTELLHQAGLLEMAGRAARFGGWSVDLESQKCEWSNVVADIHGMPHGYSPSVDEAIAFCAPEFRDRIRQIFKACAEQGVPFDEELQVIASGGQRVWVRTLGEPVRDEHGRIVRVQGAFQDVTNRIEQEQQLRRSRRELESLLESRKALINSLPANIALLDAEGTIIDVNDQWRHYGEDNASRDNSFGLGVNYLHLCERASLHRADESSDVAGGLRAVLHGEQEAFTLEYPCHSPDKFQWFRVMANRLVPGAEHGAVVMHVDITERKLAEQELDRIAFEDLLTRLYSRSGFTRQLQARIDQSGWQSRGTVVMLDIVGQRDVNDAHGYAAGDQLLVEFGHRLREQTGDSGFVGRIGGDEFMLFLLPGDDEGVEASLGRLAESLSVPFELAGIEMRISVRLGYTRMGEHERPVQDLLREAELALYRHRMELNLPWVAYNTDMQAENHQRIELTRDLRRALDEDQLELVFQPKVDLGTGMLVASEALLRWHHPERGLIPPDRFIPVAEQSQLIGPIGDWVLRRACSHIRAWRSAGIEPVRVAVNVSLVQFQMGDFTGRLRSILEEFDISPGELALEITESVFESQSDSPLEQVQALHDMGVRLSLDDFGTGYSSLMYLQRYPFDEIKVDKAFVFHLLDDRFSRNIVEMVMSVARAINAEVVAEGIESDAVSEALKLMGCRVGQGFYYSKPLEKEVFRRLLEQRCRLPDSSGALTQTS